MNDTADEKPSHVLTIADFNFDPPELPLEQLREIAGRLFHITGTFTHLEGERDQNCRIVSNDGHGYVLKVSSTGEDQAVIDFQAKALLHIEQHDATIPVPRMVHGADGEVVYWTSSDKGAHQVRMLTWLEGIRYQDGPPPSLRGLTRIGAFLARLCRALQGFTHPAQRHFMPWDITNGLLFRQQLRELLCAEVRVLVAPVLRRLEQATFPALAGLRRQVIHQDGHGANLLRQSAASEQVAGLIDFGDMIHGPLIYDLAASLSDFIHHASGPAAVAAAMCRGFNSVIPLRPAETDLLLDLVIARHILVLELFEFRRRNMQHPPAFVTDDQPALIASLARLTELDRETFNRALRETCT